MSEDPINTILLLIYLYNSWWIQVGLNDFNQFLAELLLTDRYMEAMLTVLHTGFQNLEEKNVSQTAK